MVTVLLDTAATSSAAALAAVLAAAAVVKISTLGATADEFAALGLGRSPVLPALVAAAEIGTAVALFVRPPVGAVAAAVLLVTFTGFIVWALAADRRVSCGCFGPLSNEPVSSTTVVRNIVLLALAGMAGIRSDLTMPDPAALVAISTAAMTVAVIAQAAMTTQRLGRLWSVELAGEMSRESIARTGRSEE